MQMQTLDYNRCQYSPKKTKKNSCDSKHLKKYREKIFQRLRRIKMTEKEGICLLPEYGF